MVETIALEESEQLILVLPSQFNSPPRIRVQSLERKAEKHLHKFMYHSNSEPTGYERC